MSNEILIQDQIITRIITEILTDDPCSGDVRIAVDNVKHRLGNRLVHDHTLAESSYGNRGSVVSSRWRFSILRLSLAAAIIGSISLWQWIPSSRVGTGMAFGQILDTVRRATSMSYTAIEHPPEGGGESIQFQVYGMRWLRIITPSKGTRIIDLQESKLLQYDHPQCPEKNATLTTFIGQAALMLHAAAGPLSDLSELLPSDGEPLGSKVIDGQSVTGFRVRQTTIVDGRGDYSVWDIWADSETARVVRVDIHHEAGEGEGKLTLVDFNFNVELEDSLFTLQPPIGYTIDYETIEEIDPADR